jgi:hypothetical protein
MANYAHVISNEIQGVYDKLPKNWKNISNFNLLTDSDIEQFGWQRIVKDVPDYDNKTHKIDSPTHILLNGTVHEQYELIALPVLPKSEQKELTEEELIQLEQQRINQQWDSIRNTRDKLMQDFDWRYVRYEREVRLNLPTTDDIIKLDEYMQSLADITLQEDPFNIVWPEFNQ